MKLTLCRKADVGVESEAVLKHRLGYPMSGTGRELLWIADRCILRAPATGALYERELGNNVGEALLAPGLRVESLDEGEGECAQAYRRAAPQGGVAVPMWVSNQVTTRAA